MPIFRTGTVCELIDDRPGLQRVRVDLGEGPEPAYALTALVGDLDLDDRVVVNTTAVDLDLGTGGWHVVHWNLRRNELRLDGGGHIMKLRYTGLQADAGAAEEHHDEPPADLDGVPVVACTVHSQLPCVVVGARSVDPELRIAYVMTDGAALPVAHSDLVAALRDRDLLAGVITNGHAFGGDLETVDIHAGLAHARHTLAADLVVVAMGPGVVGTGTTLGTTALETVGTLNAAAALGGHPVFCVRVSDGDPRARHHGLSHHAATILDLVAGPVHLAHDPALTELSAQTLDRHDVLRVDPVDTARALAALDLEVTTMGRPPADDPAFFAAAGAAGALGARLTR